MLADNIGALLATFTWDINPAIFKAGFIELRYYGLLFASALAIGYGILRWQFREDGEDPEAATMLTYALVAGVVFGARLGHVFFYDAERYLANPIEILKFWKGGLASHGATIGIITVSLIWALVYRKEPVRIILDRMAMTIPVASIFVRLGNFFNSEIVGAPAEVPWAVVFPRYDMVPRHPSQLYESGFGVIILVVMFGVYFYYKKHKKTRPLGLLGSLLLTLYFSMRFIVEFFKEYQVDDMIGSLRMGQVLSIPFILLGVTGILLCLVGPWAKQNVRQFNKTYRIDDKDESKADEPEPSKA